MCIVLRCTLTVLLLCLEQRCMQVPPNLTTAGLTVSRFHADTTFDDYMFRAIEKDHVHN